MNKNNKAIVLGIEEEIKELVDTIRAGKYEDGEHYETLIKRLSELQELRRQMDLKFRVDPNVVIAGLVNIGGILVVLNYEKLGVISSKAFSMISKVKSRV